MIRRYILYERGKRDREKNDRGERERPKSVERRIVYMYITNCMYICVK